MLSTQMGRLAMGLGPLGGPALYDVLVATITAPTGTVSVGPTIAVEWTYSQPQTRPQLSYRLVWTNAAQTVTFYDSGTVLSDADTTNIDVSSIDIEGVGEAVDSILTLTLAMDATDGQDPGPDTDTEDITTELGNPHMTFEEPDEGDTLTTAQVTAEWSFTDDRMGQTQAYYRIWLYRTGDSFLLYDSTWLPGALTSHLIPVSLNHGTNYTLKGQLKNNDGVLSD